MKRAAYVTSEFRLQAEAGKPIHRRWAIAHGLSLLRQLREAQVHGSTAGKPAFDTSA